MKEKPTNTTSEVMQDSSIIPCVNQNMKGIWKDAGFEKLLDLEQDIQEARQELSEMIFEKMKNLIE